jgi:hypothetical protein
MHGKFPAIQQNHRNSILFHETIPLKNAIADQGASKILADYQLAV